MSYSDVMEYLRDLNQVSIVLRLVFSLILGGIIGLERERKGRPAGFRTHMLVCMGASLVMMINQYIYTYLHLTSDVARLGAQVISGIGFLGAGTIIVTGKQQVKGLTTAAGLWASACMGLAIGIGFYEGAILSCFFIFTAMKLLNKFDAYIMSTSKNMSVYVQLAKSQDLGKIIEEIKQMGLKILDIQITKGRADDPDATNAIISLLIKGKRKIKHTDILMNLALIDGVSSIEEI